MKKLQMIALLIAAVALTACESAPKTRSNTDTSVNFATYHTYGFISPLGTDRGGVSTPLSGYFKNAVRRELDARGYKYVEGQDADLLVNFNTNSQEKVDVRSTPGPSYGVGYGGYYGYRGGMYGGMMVGGAPEVETVRYKVGTANIDVVDARQKKLVWEGLAEGKLTNKMMENPQATIDSVIADMFTKFPGRAGS
jgi:hypothetical protein